MLPLRYFQNVLLGGVALLFGVTRVTPEADKNGPVLDAAIDIMTGGADTSRLPSRDARVSRVTVALDAFNGVVRPLSHSRALEDAFTSYFAYKAAFPQSVKKPLLYFVDYGLPSTTPRGYVFDMNELRVVDGPFMVAHGRGSAASSQTVPTRFSNRPNSYATSLGLYVAQETYRFSGKAAGRTYSSVGLRLEGVSSGYNDNARIRKVVAHGAPYVTPSRAGRSEGCPAMEQQRAKKLLPALANGGLVFLFAPDQEWMQKDPWVTASGE